MTVKLPGWIIKFDEMNSCCTSISDYKMLYKALTIAIEALEHICNEPLGPSDATHKEVLQMAERIGKEALTRIAALGGKENG